jgi:hypothetical protein
LQKFHEGVNLAVAALHASDEYRAKDLNAAAVRARLAAHLIDTYSERDEKFYWHRDLLPLARSASILFFIEILAGFLFSLSRRHESLSQAWARQRRACERILAMPGILADINQPAASDAIATGLLSSDDEGAAADPANPHVEALSAALASIAAQRPPTLK